jgi:HlyD family secretion protein
LNEGNRITKPANQPTLYLLSQGQPAPVNVTTGISDGNFTEIIDGEVKAGDKVIISEVTDKKEAESKFKLRVF